MSVSGIIIEAAAIASHEANRAYCRANGDYSLDNWHDSPEWQRVSVRQGVLGVIAGNNPEKSHESWLAVKSATGWKWGPVKDPEKKEHPCMVPYDHLPLAQKRKDHIFVSVCRAVLEALGVEVKMPPDQAIEEARLAVAEIEAMSDDFEEAHGLEDKLYRRTLLLIANKECANPAELAKVTLTTSEIDFARYCA